MFVIYIGDLAPGNSSDVSNFARRKNFREAGDEAKRKRQEGEKGEESISHVEHEKRKLCIISPCSLMDGQPQLGLYPKTADIWSFYQINQSVGAAPGGQVTAPTLRCQPLGIPQASPFYKPHGKIY